jgi:hypothetical protein
VKSATARSPGLETTTLTFEPFVKPLSASMRHTIDRFVAVAVARGYTVVKGETEHAITLAAVKTVARHQES